MSVTSEYDHAEQVVADVALLQDMAEGRLDDERVKQAAQVLLEHRREELPSVSVALAARLLGVSRTIIESWRDAGVLTSVPVRRRRYQITIESIVRVQALLEELRRLMRRRQIRVLGKSGFFPGVGVEQVAEGVEFGDAPSARRRSPPLTRSPVCICVR